MGVKLVQLSLYKGEARVLRFTITDEATGLVEDISAWEFEWKFSTSDDQAIVTKILGDGISINDGPNGIVDVTLDEATTLTEVVPASCKDYYQQFLWRSDTGNEAVLAYGRVKLLEDA